MDHDDWDAPDGADPAHHPAEPDASPTPTAVERTGPRPLAHGGRTSPRRRAATVVAVVATLAIATVAFGAELGLVGHRGDGDTGPTEPPKAVVETTDKPAPSQAPDSARDETVDGAKGPDAIEPTEKPEPTATDKPEPKPTEKPKPEPTKKPEPKATEKPEPKPTEKPRSEVKALEIAVVIKEGHVVVKWSACGVDGAEAYKVVRSSDSTVRWPLGDGDELIAVVGMDGTLKAWDEHAPSGKKGYYRVFCVRHGEDGYRVLAKTPVGSIVAPDATPKPTPKPTPEVTSMWLETSVDGGAIVLHWEGIERDAFSHYRIVRKVDGDGSVIAEIEDAGTTSYRDEAVEPGVTYHYLVQAKGHVGDDWFLLGTTDWVGASID